MSLRFSTLALTGTLAAACAPTATQMPVPLRMQMLPELIKASPQDAGMRADLNAHLDSIMQVALGEGVAPGGSLAVGRYGRAVHMKGYGKLDKIGRASCRER